MTRTFRKACWPLLDGRRAWTLAALLFIYHVLVPSQYLVLPLPGVLSDIPRYVPLGLCVVIALSVLPVRPRARLPDWLVAIGAWFLICLVGDIGSLSPELALTRIVFYFVTGPVLLIACERTGIDSRTQRNLLALMFFTAVLVATIGVAERVFGLNPYAFVFYGNNASFRLFTPDVDALKGRILSTVGHPVYLGILLATILPIGLAGVRVEEGGRRVLWAVGSFVVLVSIALTLSRGAWIATLISVVVFYVGPGRKAFVLAALVLVAAVGILLSFDQSWEDLLGRSTRRQLSVDTIDPRGLAYRSVSDMLMDRPFFGVGTANYRYASKYYGDNDDTPDSMYLRILGENGLAGFAVFVVAAGLLFRTLMARARNQIGGASSRVRAITAGLIGFCVDMLFCDAFYFSVTRVTFWLLAALGISLPHAPTEVREGPGSG